MSSIQRLPDGAHQLLVNGSPFLMRAAELNNSSLSSPRYMNDVWPRMVQNNVNTVLGAVTWDQIEPVEGNFDFVALDQVIQGAREHHLKLVLLWFGSFKNGKSVYVPEWVKLDAARFPRAMVRQKETKQLLLLECLSVLHENSSTADAKAFAALLQHLKEYDSEQNTVIMVQVENEVGLLGDSRDRSDAAQSEFASPVPSHLKEVLKSQWDTLNSSLKANLAKFINQTTTSSANWGEVFGSDNTHADEIFMAYHYALYLEKIASAGKAAYSIPLYTNAWLPNLPDDEDLASHYPPLLGGGTNPGHYPSGGPVETVLDIWQLFAPSLDFVAPDIYLSNYQKTCRSYRHRDQPLFIPEQRRDEPGALRMWAALGEHGALGVSPFGIDSTSPDVSPFTKHYNLLRQITPNLLRARAEGRRVHGFFFDRFSAGEPDPSPSQQVTMGSWILSIDRAFVFGHPDPAFGLVIQLDVDRFLLVGEGFQISFASKNPGVQFTGIRSFREKESIEEDGQVKLQDGRWLNGDEAGNGRAVIMPSEDPDYGGFFICSFIPARTRIAECSIYSLA